LLAAGGGLILAVILSGAGYSLAVAGGLWMLCAGGALIAHTLLTSRRRAEPSWGPAIAGQALGVAGLAILFLASLSHR
jgi:hypothetical protein